MKILFLPQLNGSKKIRRFSFAVVSTGTKRTELIANRMVGFCWMQNCISPPTQKYKPVLQQGN